jgi:DNA-binding CsgD family transcriptional regulator
VLDRQVVQITVAKSAMGLVTGGDQKGERLDGVVAVRARLAELAAAARSECLALLPALLSHSVHPVLRPPGRVRWRGLYQDSLRDDPRTIRQARRLADRGGQARTVAAVPMLLFVVDRGVAVLAVGPRGDRCDAVVLHGSAVEGMHDLFEEFWAAASPWGPPVPPTEPTLTAQQREVVRLLAEGLTDEGISRRIGVSLRTVRQIASELMLRLAARSRFEAGVKAARSGWIG